MNVRYYENEKSINAELARDSDVSLFQKIANELTLMNVSWKDKISGFDQRYWDFEFRGIDLTLHLEHYLGINIYVDKSLTDIESAKRILEEIGDHFKVWNPSN